MPASAEDNVEILCPVCDYRPTVTDRWSCMPSCGATFHTFWTRALCPACGWRWAHTQCPACGEISAHEKWYRQKRPTTERHDTLESVPA